MLWFVLDSFLTMKNMENPALPANASDLQRRQTSLRRFQELETLFRTVYDRLWNLGEQGQAVAGHIRDFESTMWL